MKEGLLWYDDSTLTLDEKVQRACTAYAQRFSVAANTVYVHPSEVGTGLTTVMTSDGGTQVIADKAMLLHHFFAVREEMSKPACPQCGSTLFYREDQRVRRKGGGWTGAGWWVCPEPDCWHKWDGITDSSDGVLPAGVVARSKPTVQATEEDT